MMTLKRFRSFERISKDCDNIKANSEQQKICFDVGKKSGKERIVDGGVKFD